MIRWFHEITKEDVMTAGGKGANLGEMTRASLAVPEGFVITSDAYRLFLKENKLQQEKAEKMQEKILSGKMPEALQQEIVAAYQKMGEQARVAVRSSATAEDLADASFAGQQETYLNVRGVEELLVKVKECFASLWGNRAVSYRKTQGYDKIEVALAVVVQKMVESEKSGVLFTADPVSKKREVMQLNASYGLGEAVVSGMVSADSYLCTKDGKVKEATLGSKKIQVVYDDHGTKTIAVPEAMQSRACLTEEEIQKVCEAGARVEAYYGKPMDIEWGIVDGTVYILQARAITTLTEEVDEALVQKYLAACHLTGTMKNGMVFMMEKMPMAYYPLDLAFMSAINMQKKNLFAEAGIEIDQDPVMDDLGVSVLPADKKRINGKIVHLFPMLKEIKDLEGCCQKLNILLPQYQKQLDLLKEVDAKTLSLLECADYSKKIYELVCKIAYTRFRYSLFPGVLGQRKLTKVLKKVSPDLTAYDIYYHLNNKTAEVTRDMGELAQKIREHDALKQAILSGIHYERLMEEYPDCAESFEVFLRKNGMKSDYNCYCIVAKTFREEPDRLLQILRPLLVEQEEAETDQFTPLMEKLKSLYGEKKYQKLEKDIQAYRLFHVAREESQYQWETAFYYERKILKRAASLLTGNENMTNELAFLFLDEFYEACKIGKISAELQEKIEKRKRMRPLAEKVWEGAKYSLFDDAGDHLTGVSGSVGEAVGRACIVHGPSEFYKLKKGDILICPLTDPEWTPLFKVAAAVVADTGSSLSHAAIVAREYGIPAVLGVGVATLRYQDGDLVRVNGGTGEVSRAK